MLNGVWRKIVKLDSVHIEKCTEKWVKRKRETSRKVVGEHHPFIPQRMGNFFILVWIAKATGHLRNLALLLQIDQCLLRDVGALPVAGPLLRHELLAEVAFPVVPACFFLAMDAKWKQRGVEEARGRR